MTALQPCPVLLMVRELGIGGCERDLTKLAKRLDRRLFQPHVACFHGDGLRSDELRVAGVPIVRIPVRSFLSLSAFRGAVEMGGYIVRHGIRLVHAFDVPTVIFAAPVARAFRIQVVIASQLGHRYMFPSEQRHLVRATDSMVDAVVVNSLAVRRHLIDDEKTPDRLTYLCYNGVETEMFFPKPAPRLEVVSGASLVIGSVCALRAEKRMDLLLRAFAQVHSLQPGMKLLIVGSGEMLSELEEIRRCLGLQSDCIFEPARKDVADCMRAMDVFVLPSSSESFPNALLEAMACGCCAIGSRAGGIPELISDGETGLLFETNNLEALVRVLAHCIQQPAERLRLGAAAAVSARSRFSMEKAVRRTEYLYRSLLEHGRVPLDVSEQGSI